MTQRKTRLFQLFEWVRYAYRFPVIDIPDETVIPSPPDTWLD